MIKRWWNVNNKKAKYLAEEILKFKIEVLGMVDKQIRQQQADRIEYINSNRLILIRNLDYYAYPHK